jgi:hypothetical protein
MAGMAWIATTPRSSTCCCGPAIAHVPTARGGLYSVIRPWRGLPWLCP